MMDSLTENGWVSDKNDPYHPFTNSDNTAMIVIHGPFNHLDKVHGYREVPSFKEIEIRLSPLKGRSARWVF